MEQKRRNLELDSQLLEEALFASADGYCKFDLTQDLVCGSLHNVVDGVVYDLNEQLGLPEDAGYTETVAHWAADMVPESDRELFLHEMDRDTLLERFRKGEQHTTFHYWTRSAMGEPLYAENHLVMFQNQETGDVVGLNYMLDRTEQYRLKQYQEELEQKNKELEALLEAEKGYNVKLYHDALTGTFNRRYYEEIVLGASGPAGVALMDLDDFKVYNDTYGHYAGDLALEVAAGAIRSCIRSNDILIRFGGDEFLLVLEGIPANYLKTKLEQIRDKVRSAIVPGFSHLRLSLSIGGTMQSVKDPMDVIVRRVDRLMYQAKDQKNAVIVDLNGEVHSTLDPADDTTHQQILIVDDSAMNRALLAEILGEDFRILEAENGKKCMEMLYEYPQDIALVLLDINMPEMNGYDVLRAMNADHSIEDVPVIMISSDDSETAIRQSYELGASDYVSRPFDARVVYRRVTNTIKLYTKQRRLIQLVSNQIRKQEHNTSMLVGVLSQIVEFRNGESGSHVRHIRIITELLLNRLLTLTGRYIISPEEQEDIPLASALHDIGKIAIDEKILNKPGRLTPEEFAVVKTHSMRGAEMLARLENFEDEPLLHTAYEIARWHHERWDGKGYPDGLKGDDIPISAQVVAMADVYDALTSERCYKPPYTHETAIQMICNGECGAFNPLLVRCLTDVQDELRSELQSDYAETLSATMLHGRSGVVKAGWRDTMIVQALLPEFDYVCRIEVASQDYTIFYSSDSETSIPQYSSTNYNEGVRLYNNKHVVDAEAEDLTRKMQLENVQKQLEHAAEYELYFTLKDVEKPYKKLRFCYAGENRSILLMTRMDVSGEMCERMKREQIEKLHENLLTNMPVALCSTEVLLDENQKPYDFRYTYCNPAHEKLEGVKPGELLGKRFYQFFQNADPKWLHYYYETGWLGIPHVIKEYSPEIGKELVIHTFRTEPGHCDCVVRDVTQENFLIRELHQSREEIKRVLENTMIAVFQYDPETDEIQRNIYSTEESSQKFHLHELFELFAKYERVDEESLSTLRDCFRRMQRGEHSLSAPIRCKKRNATDWIWCKISLFDYQDEVTKARRVLGYIQDINSDMKRQTRLLEQAQTDALTKLLNVGAGRGNVRKYLKSTAKGCNAMIMMDVDNFKVVNDTHGHLVGDNTLKALAAVLNSTFAEPAIVYRLGGDEFVVFLPHLTAPEEEIESRMKDFQKQLRNARTEYPFLSVSAGVYITNKTLTYEDYYRAADNVLYQTKKSCKGQYTVVQELE